MFCKVVLFTMYNLKGSQFAVNDLQSRPIYIELFAKYSYLK